MERIRLWLSGKKTYLTGVAGILTALAGWSAGTIDAGALVNAIMIALQAMTLRAAVAKVVPTPPVTVHLVSPTVDAARLS